MDPTIASARAPLVLVLVHGNWSTHRSWIPLAAELPDHHLLALATCVAAATPSDPTTATPVPELADDLRALLDALGLERVTGEVADVIRRIVGTGEG